GRSCPAVGVPSRLPSTASAGQQIFDGQHAVTDAMMLLLIWSWVATHDLVAERRQHARKLARSRLSVVSDVLVDYHPPDRPDGSHGPRPVAKPAELASPVWRCESFERADHAVEFTTATGRVFTCSWDTPGFHEGIWIREIPAQGPVYANDANVAV